jgi:hypothetical protein
MIIGFLMLAIILGYWTVKSASSMPVQETNDYMLKYQLADININDILRSKQRFDNKYQIELKDVEMMVMTDNIHSMRVQHDQVKLVKGPNRFSYSVADKSGKIVRDANVSFLLTRPHTVVDDQMIESVSISGDRYITPDINLSKPGRYTLQLRVKIGNDTGYSHIEAYLQPEK